MKTIITILFLLGLDRIAFSQNASAAAQHCPIIYSEAIEAYVYESSSGLTCSELIIEHLPPSSQPSVPVKLNLPRGTYSFKKSDELILPDNCMVYIEDNLTGQVFDLRSIEKNSFNVVRNISDRFVLSVKSSSKLALNNP